MYPYENMLDYKLAHESLQHLTVARTVRYLVYIFDCGVHEIQMDNVTTTPVAIATNPQYAGCLANLVPIHFWGGPPDEGDWYQGSLLTMLIDKLFYCVVMGYEDVIEKFLGVLNGARIEVKATKKKPASCA